MLINTALHLTRRFADYRFGFDMHECSGVDIGSGKLKTESIRVRAGLLMLAIMHLHLFQNLIAVVSINYRKLIKFIA